MARLAVVAVDGCLASGVTGTIDAVAIADHWIQLSPIAGALRMQVDVVSEDGEAVMGFAGTPIRVDRSIADAQEYDIVIVPPVVLDPLGAFVGRADLVGWVAGLPQTTIVSSVGTGAFLLAEAGLLDGQVATTNPALADVFSRRYPEVELSLSSVLVDNGRVITAGTITAFIDLALHLVHRVAGHVIAVSTAKAMGFDRNRSTQAPYLLPASRPHTDVEVQGVQARIRQDFAQPLTLESLAKSAAMSPRTLLRRFRAATGATPMEYLRQVRIESAKQILECTRRGVSEITNDVGYEDPRSFGRLFKRSTGLTPSEYRKRFGAPS